MTIWHIYKTAGPDLWQWLGTLESDYSFVPPPVQAVGEAYGTGRFMFTCEESGKYVVKRIASEPNYFEEDDEPTDEEPIEPQSIRHDIDDYCDLATDSGHSSASGLVST